MTAFVKEIEKQIIEKFEYPKQAVRLIPFFFGEKEIELITQIEKDCFDSRDYPTEVLTDWYQRGILSYKDKEKGIFQLGTFYTMLDVFVVSKQELYATLSKEDRNMLDDWYFNAYYDGLKPGREVCPTDDRVLPLEETLEFIEQESRPIYLNECDCRSLLGDCKMPTQTCLTYKSGPNTLQDRGLSKALTKEEAKEVVRKADKAGLIHTVNANGICNCCTDCCYLFRSQSKRDSVGIWPATKTLVHLDSDKCIGCGRCIKRCGFQLFKKEETKVTCHTSGCVGCGLCVNTCPTGALILTER